MSFGLRCPGPRADGNQAEERAALQNFEYVNDIKTAIGAASSRIMFAAASSNSKDEGRAFPANYSPWVICVHASDGLGNDCGINPLPTETDDNFTTLGMGIELLARQWVHTGPTSIPTYKSVYRSGTSFATPIAAGIAATVLDLAVRVSAIGGRAREKLRKPEEMRKMLRLMSSPKNSFGSQYRFLAPWNHWERHWQASETKSQMVWDSINALFGA